MSEKHFMGPLVLREHWSGNGEIEICSDPIGVAMATLPNWGTDEIKADAQRLVACWNACEGISTEALEGEGHAALGWTRTASKLIQATAQRDKLLAAVEEWFCQECRTVFPRGHVNGFEIACPCGGGTLRPSSYNQRSAETQRDKLLAALRRCRFDSLNMSMADLEFCRAAIAEVTGGKS